MVKILNQIVHVAQVQTPMWTSSVTSDKLHDLERVSGVYGCPVYWVSTFFELPIFFGWLMVYCWTQFTIVFNLISLRVSICGKPEEIKLLYINKKLNYALYSCIYVRNIQYLSTIKKRAVQPETWPSHVSGSTS